MKDLANVTITEIVSVDTVIGTKNFARTVSNRAYFGLSFCEEGQIIYTHEGKSVVSDRNCAILLPQGKTYSLRWTERGRFPLINFYCAAPLCNTPTAIPIPDAEPFLKLYEQLRMLRLFDGNRAKEMSVLYDVFHHLSVCGTVSAQLRPAIRYIEAHYMESDIQNKVLAEECRISEVHLRKLFAKHLNTSPKQYILDVRMEKAKQLLAENRMKVHAIAELCGFTSLSHFCRYFKRKTGVTPMEYVKQNQMGQL